MQLIETPERVPALLAELEDEPLLAADTEAAGYHRYHDRICLLQLSTRTQTWVIDALVVDIASLHDAFNHGQRELILHDADYDLRLLARDHGIRPGRLFDTKLAAQFLGEPAIGLAGLVEKYLGVKLDKKHQRADWARRPLPRELLEYAADDTRFLPQLRDRLRDELEARGRLHWAAEEFELRTAETAEPAPADADAWLKLKNLRDLSPRQLAALREVHAWRDRTARERDVAPFRILSNEVLVAVARAMPTSTSSLPGTPGIDAAAIRHGRELVRAVKRARELPEAELPVRPRGPRRPPPDPVFEARVERLKTLRDAAADRLGLDRGFLMPRQQLEAIARALPRSIEELRAVQDIREWQVEVLGHEVVDAIR